MSPLYHISQAHGSEAAVMAPACISAIFEHTFENSHIRASHLGEDLFIHKNYTDFRPLTPDMNVTPKFTGFKTPEEKTRAETNKNHQLHYTYKKNQYGFKTNIDKYRINDAQDKIIPINPLPEKSDLENAQYAAQRNAESRIYTKKACTHTIREKRGIITNVSRKSANRLKKFLASIPDLGLWVDFTFPDDVMLGKTLAQRIHFANECLKKLKRYIHSIGLKEVWKKEFTDRKSGQLKGLDVPHYHIILTGLSLKQEKDWQLTCIKILYKWVKIIGSKDNNAVVVACHKKSFRKIESSKQAISYIGKYFSKTNEVQDESGDVISIGRAWGYARSLKDQIPDPHHLYLNRSQSVKFRRFMRRYKKLKPNKKFMGAYEHMTKGYATFLFADETTVLRFLMSIGVDITQKAGVPF